MGLKCLVITCGTGSLPGSMEPETAGTNAAAINNIGRNEASSREYKSAVSIKAKKFVGAGSRRATVLYGSESANCEEPLRLRLIASSTDPGLIPATRI